MKDVIWLIKCDATAALAAFQISLMAFWAIWMWKQIKFEIREWRRFVRKMNKEDV